MDDDFLERIERINVLQTKKYRAPHKPLLLLLALGRVWAGEPRLAPYETLERPLKKLLLDFGPPRKVLHPEYPFGHLLADDLWHIPGGRRLPTRKGSIPRKELIRTQGGFPKQFYALLHNDRRLVRLAAQLLLDGHFPPSLHDDILAAAGMGSMLRTAEGLEEDREFKANIFQAYDRRCAICGLDLRINDEPVDLDAAHIRWRAQCGPNCTSNGLALCTLHHKAFDRGALGLKPDRGGYAVMVSNRVAGRTRQWFQRLQNKQVIRPASDTDAPDPGFVGWHRREVFRSPDLGS